MFWEKILHTYIFTTGWKVEVASSFEKLAMTCHGT
jgi:hypothetical protein